MSPYLKADATISAMASVLRRFHFFDQLFERRVPAKLALTQAGFGSAETERLVDAAVLYERRRREAFGVSCAARSGPARPLAARSGRAA